MINDGRLQTDFYNLYIESEYNKFPKLNLANSVKQNKRNP